MQQTLSASILFEHYLHRMFKEGTIDLDTAREAAPHMKRQGGGRIVNISGGAARSTGLLQRFVCCSDLLVQRSSADGELNVQVLPIVYFLNSKVLTVIYNLNSAKKIFLIKTIIMIFIKKGDL